MASVRPTTGTPASVKEPISKAKTLPLIALTNSRYRGAGPLAPVNVTSNAEPRPAGSSRVWALSPSITSETLRKYAAAVDSDWAAVTTGWPVSGRRSVRTATITSPELPSTIAVAPFPVVRITTRSPRSNHSPSTAMGTPLNLAVFDSAVDIGSGGGGEGVQPGSCVVIVAHAQLGERD